MLKVVNITLPLDYDDAFIKKALSERLRVSPSELLEIHLDRRSLEKDGGELRFKAIFLCRLAPETEKKRALILRKKGVSSVTDAPYAFPVAKKRTLRPVVVGFGPAGIFSALVLAKAGLSPIVLERGEESEKREKKVENFTLGGSLDEECNIQFGEGGAGAFSDGKLKIGYKDKVKRMILSELVKAGADESIEYLEKAHVGSDVLRRVIVNLRRKIISLGGEIIFGAKLVDIDIENGGVRGVVYSKDGTLFQLPTDTLVLAIGHSARDTYEMLYNKGFPMEPKGFGVGVRIEHRQSTIDRIEYGDASLASVLGAADYKMVTHLDNGRSLYTFCMCPGGFVVPATSEKEGICTNGMSNFKRDGVNANTALLVSVTPKDFPSHHPLAGVAFQREIERSAFLAAGGNYFAPVIRLEDFLKGGESRAFGEVLPTYRPGTAFVKPEKYLPPFIVESLRDGIKNMCEYKNGYYEGDALLTGPETRSTSPVKMLRREGFDAIGIDGVYPVGEGAGYSGGIISSAVDGVLAADTIVKRKDQL